MCYITFTNQQQEVTMREFNTYQLFCHINSLIKELQYEISINCDGWHLEESTDILEIMDVCCGIWTEDKNKTIDFYIHTQEKSNLCGDKFYGSIEYRCEANIIGDDTFEYKRVKGWN